MSIPPIVVATARKGWNWQWNQLMNGLAPSDKSGNYLRPSSQHQEAKLPPEDELQARSKANVPVLIIGRSCPWAHRTWLVHQIKGLKENLRLVIAKADHQAGRWRMDPPLLGCDSLLALYQLSGSPPSHRATVPSLIDPIGNDHSKPKLLGNESAQLVELLNQWPTQYKSSDLAPKALQKEISEWQELLQPSVNNGVYRCGFARNQSAYDNACDELFSALKTVNQSLANKGPWLCGEQMTLADIRLFPTLIRWEMIYQPFFGCSQAPLWSFPHLWEWRQKLLSLPKVAKTCDAKAWRTDYFGALFPLQPSNIVPAGPDLYKMVNAVVPVMK